MSLCASCRLALRQAVRHRRLLSTTTTTTTPTPATATATAAASASASSSKSKPTSTQPPIPQSIRDILSKPSWSVSTLFAQDPAAPPAEDITPPQLHHLLRLSALPLPQTKDEQDSMIATIQSQLRFVKAVQDVDTDGVQPLRAIRDETRAALRESTIGLDGMRDLLDREAPVGHYRRLKRVRGQTREAATAAEEWEVMSAATRRAGKYFVVDSGKKTDDAAGA